MKGIACYLPAWEFMLSLFHNSISCGHPRKSLFWISQIKVTWTNSRISEFPLEKALSTAMSCLWLKCFCCLLQFVRNKQGRGFQFKQIKHKVCQCSIYFEWNTCGFAWFCCAIQGRKCLWRIFVMRICKAIQLYFPASQLPFCSQALNGEVQARCAVFFTLLLRECASCKCPFTGTVLG